MDLHDLLKYHPEDIEMLNRLARILYAATGCEVCEGFDFTKSAHPHEQRCFAQACIAMNFFQEEGF